MIRVRLRRDAGWRSVSGLRGVGGAWLVLAAVGCGGGTELPTTGVVVEITADQAVCDDAPNLRMQFYGRAGEIGRWMLRDWRTVALSDCPVTVPWTVFLSPERGDTRRRWRVVAEAFDGGGDVAVQAERFGAYAPGRRESVRIHLAEVCRGRNCPEGRTCVDEDGVAVCSSARVEFGPDGGVDEGCDTPTAYYADCDGDGYAAMGASSVEVCAMPAGSPGGCPPGAPAMWTTRSPEGDSSDCADDDPDVHPGAAEACNGVDDDCDGRADWEDPDTSGPWDPTLCDRTDDGIERACFLGACRVAAGTLDVGNQFGCALASDRQVYCWGRNDSGQLGRGSGDDTIAAPVDGDETYRWVGTGGGHACAVREDGMGVDCWGLNRSEQLGVGGTDNKRSPTPVCSADMDCSWPRAIRMVAAGSRHTCVALVGTGDPRGYCWGYNFEGQVLNDSEAFTISRRSEWKTSGTWTARWLAAGGSHNAILAYGPDDTFGTLLAGGDNRDGRLGLGVGNATISLLTGMSDGCEPKINEAVRIAAGYRHTCILLETGAVRCAGNSESGTLGDGTTESAGGSTPGCTVAVTAAVGEELPPFVAMDAATDNTCAVGADGSVWCWGSNRGRVVEPNARIGESNFRNPHRVVDLGPAAERPVVEIAVGFYHSCARLLDGSVYCWGSPSRGALGNGMPDDMSGLGPVKVLGLPASSM